MTCTKKLLRVNGCIDGLDSEGEMDINEEMEDVASNEDELSFIARNIKKMWRKKGRFKRGKSNKKYSKDKGSKEESS